MVNSTCLTISVCKLLQIVNFDGCELGWFDIFDSFSLVNQSDYLDHYNKDSYWLIVACFMTARSMLTTLLFALAINFILKIESNVWGILRIRYRYFFFALAAA